MYKLVLLRHGESDWNRENRFTGWTDVDLSAKGVEEARAGGRLLKAEGYKLNETIHGAITDFLEIVTEENEDMEDDADDGLDDEVEGVDGFKAER